VSYDIKELTLRHKEVIRLAFVGKSAVEIAGVVGMDRTAVSAILRSPLARLELDRLTAAAEEKIVNVPARAALMSELSGCGVEAVRINRNLMKDDAVQPRTRASIARHFMDRIIFDQAPENEKRESYREILRRLDTVQASLSRDLMIVPVNARGADPAVDTGPDDDRDAGRVEAVDSDAPGNGNGCHE